MKTGDKYVCIKKKGCPSDWDKHYQLVGQWPDIGQVFVLNHVYFHKNTKQIGLGFINSSVICLRSSVEVGWDSQCFRSLDEMKMEAKLAETLKIS